MIVDHCFSLSIQGASVSGANYDGRTALHIACGIGNLEVVQFLLKHGACVHAKDIRGETPLMDAILAKSLPIVNLLKQTGASLTWSNMRIACRLCT
jgi:ankyrin repeat protein